MRTLVAGPGLAGVRLDVALTRLAPELSRARARRLIDDGRVAIAGGKARASARLRGGERLEVALPDPEPTAALPQDIPLRLLLEDADLLVVDKEPGMVVHPARGAPHSTVVNALLHHLGGGPGGGRVGLVHRLDRGTSGCLVVAKTERAFAALQRAFRERSVEKTYLALCHGRLEPQGRLDTPYGRHPRDRVRFTSRGAHARRAATAWRVRERFGDLASLAEVQLLTGRTHQIRVHLAEAGHPLLGDATYGGTRREARLPPEHPLRRASAALGRQALHAWRIAFDHPATGRRTALEAPVPADLEAALAVLRAASP